MIRLHPISLRPFLTIIAAFILSVTGLSQTDHVGLWTGVDHGEVGHIQLGADEYAFFVINGDTLGGKSFSMREQLACMKYEVEYGADMHSVDFIIYTLPDNFHMATLPGIFALTDTGTLRLCLNFEGGERPSSFVEEDTIELTKVRGN